MIKAIIFDWGGVCCSGADQFSAPVLLNHFSLPAKEINKRALDIENEFIEGKISKEEFWEKIIERLSIKNITTKEELRNHYLSSYTLYPKVLEIAKKLKENYKVALLSNLNEEMELHIQENHNIKEYFNPMIFSYKVKLRKPGKKIYNLILSQLNCKPKEAVFIDDSKENIKIANELGIKGILFSCQEKLLKDLKKLNII